MHLSWRGVRECIPCQPGDFCDGCDTFASCPPNTNGGREGARISPVGATRIADCESCPQGTEASLDRTTCTDKYSDKCSEKFVQRCVRFCEAEDLSRKTLTQCETLKCTMYCAKRWSDECAQALGQYCRSLTEVDDSLQLGDVGPSTVTMLDCDVDCDGATRGGTIGLAAVFMFVVLARVF